MLLILAPGFSPAKIVRVFIKCFGRFMFDVLRAPVCPRKCEQVQIGVRAGKKKKQVAMV